MRYAVSSTPLGSRRGVPSTVNSTGRPAVRTCSTRSSICCTSGCGTYSPASSGSPVRRMPSSLRISARACRPVEEMVSSACRACSGELSRTYAAPSAWTTMTDTLWATTSCSSRAIRARSAATATFACASRSRSSRSVRSSSWARYARRVRIESPSTQASTNGTDITTVKNTWPGVETPSSGHRSCEIVAAHAPPTSASRDAQRGPSWAATV
ncbi:hypothetical protein BG846_05283 [Streptomyces fradiae ATCC 10745 = DSM 40063]|uniref:Uncharacterized protein n=1 Tax=Streptomyces fradiae ATCC 10745 = DSM 40063 TaxID=1319510 RepID=A0A1Y2NPJ9_STRFR|nr:hypothetical protein BG846_05283 [Streptomyces fradiae ATCC 10745 = DSM 40063]